MVDFNPAADPDDCGEPPPVGPYGTGPLGAGPYRAAGAVPAYEPPANDDGAFVVAREATITSHIQNGLLEKVIVTDERIELLTREVRRARGFAIIAFAIALESLIFAIFVFLRGAQ